MLRSLKSVHKQLRPQRDCARPFSTCPFQILGLKINKSSPKSNRLESSVSYEEVRIAFRQLALKHHPDMVAAKKNNDGSEQENTKFGNIKKPSTKEFTRIREAFEAIVEGPNGIAVLRDERSKDFFKGDEKNSTQSTNYCEEELNGFLHKSVNPSVLHEVAEVAATINPGGLDRGGMWQYANMIRNMAESEGKGLPPLQVDGGIDPNATRVRRRRKRK